MKILMFGRGVISAQYAWAMEKAGHTVDFYVRPGRAASYGPTLSLDIYDTRKRLSGIRIQEHWAINMIEDLPADHDYDLILVSIQHYQFDKAIEFLSSRASNATILIFNNFWQEPLQSVAALPPSQIAWGFPMAAGGFDEKGVLKGALFPGVQFGTFGTSPGPRELAARELFRSCGFKINERKDFRSWLLIHFAVNAGLHLQVLKAGSIEKVMTSSYHMKQATLNIRETIPVLRARGVSPAGEISLFKLPGGLVSLIFRLLLKLSYPLKYSLLSHSNLEELRSYCRDMLQEAKRLSVPVPRFEASSSLFEVRN
jgi:2-dehydropantoate 2-reductase